jgi:hypothetical protein
VGGVESERKEFVDTQKRIKANDVTPDWWKSFVNQKVEKFPVGEYI